MRERGVVESERRKREREREECKQQLEMFCEQFTSFIFAFPLSPSLLLLVRCVGVVLIVIYVFPSLLHIYSFIAQWNNCVRSTVRRVFRHLVALLCFCFFFFFAHILLRVRITSYAIFISILISRERERERGTEQVQS